MFSVRKDVVKKYLYFDSASTTKCSEEAARELLRFATEDFGNPSSAHIYGQKSAHAIAEARAFFAEQFHVEPNQVIFTSSGTESDNLAIYGSTMPWFLSATRQTIRVLASAIEHAAVRNTVESLNAFGANIHWIPVQSDGQIDSEKYLELLTPETSFITIQQVNNLLGTILPVDDLATEAKSRVRDLIFHTDAVQSFGKIDVPRAGSSIDLVSLSGHKIYGPKGIGALIVLNKSLLTSHRLRPLIWGGKQENGLRSGTQNAGLIAGFHIAAKRTLATQKLRFQKVTTLRNFLYDRLKHHSEIHWNSPIETPAVPHIVSLSFPQLPSSASASTLAQLLETSGCIISVGSACRSKNPKPDPVLKAIGMPQRLQNTTLRISLDAELEKEDVETLADSLEKALARIARITKIKRPGREG